AEAVDPLHLGTDRLGDGDRVRARLLADAHPNRRDAAHLDVAADVAERELHVRDVADSDRRAVDDRDDRVRDLVDARVLAERADIEVLEPLADVTARHRHVLARDRVDDVGGRELHRDEPVTDQVDVDLPVHAAPDLDRPDAGDLLEVADQVLLEDLRQVLERQRRAGAEDDDRLLVRIELTDLGRVGLRRQRLTDAVERGAHVVRGRVEVRALSETELHLGEALARPRADLLEVRNARDGVLDPLRDDQLDLLGADVRVAHANAELREFDRRKQVDRQEAEADHAERDDDEEHHRRRDRTVDGYG